MGGVKKSQNLVDIISGRFLKEDTTTRMSTIMGKIMGDAYGDNRFDFYDFIPLLVVLVGSAVLVAGLFPSGFRKVGCHEFRRISE